VTDGYGLNAGLFYNPGIRGTEFSARLDIDLPANRNLEGIWTAVVKFSGIVEPLRASTVTEIEAISKQRKNCY